MAATTQDRNTPYRDCELTPVPVAAKEKIPAGVIVCINEEGYAINGKEAPGLFYAGRSDDSVDNSDGENGDQYILVRSHKAFCWENDGSITQAHLGKRACILDNQTVTADDGSAPASGDGKADATAATRSQAGTIIMIDTDGVWVY